MQSSGSARVVVRMGVSAIVVASTMTAIPVADAHVRNKAWRQRRHVEKRAREQLGARYRYGGTSPSGFDCSGFTRWVFRDHGARLPHSSTDQFHTAGRDGYRRVWKRSRLKKGDLVFHKTDGRRVGHAGVYVGRGRFISSTSSGGVRTRSIYDPHYWGPRWVSGVRVRSLRR